MAPNFFRVLLVLTVLYAWLRGGRDERIVATMCLLGVVGTELFLPPIHARFEHVEMGVMTVDVLMFAGFTAVALRSIRFWPLWVAGLQLTTILGHIFRTIDSVLLPKAYGAALTFWSYPILLILAIGTWRRYRLDRDQKPDSPAT